MILNERENQMAKELACELLRVERERRVKATKESFESLGRAIRNAQNAYVNGFLKPINNALKSMRKGYYN